MDESEEETGACGTLGYVDDCVVRERMKEQNNTSVVSNAFGCGALVPCFGFETLPFRHCTVIEWGTCAM